MIPFIDLKAQQARIKPQIDAAIARVLDHEIYIMGPEVAELETALCEFVGSKHCITVSNGTDALVASYMALGVGPGDAVITTPFTFFATVEAIMMVGATPVFADIDPRTFNICPSQIEVAVERVRSANKLKLKGICPVDLFGLSADYESIKRIAEEHGLFVLQDAAQAFGASTPDGRRAPTHGLIGTTSFFPAKPLGCYGDGGAVFTDDDTIAEVIRSIRVHGKGVDKYDNVRVGMNGRLDTIQAAILQEKLKIYADELGRRQVVASRYAMAIEKINCEIDDGAIGHQQIPRGCESALAQFVIRSPFRDQISAELKAIGVPTVVYYRTPAHELKACIDLPLAVKLPIAENVAKQILTVPFHPYMENLHQQEIMECVRAFISQRAMSTG